MKSIKKILFVVVALATALAFVSCSSGDDEPSTVAVYKDSSSIYTATFYDDNTWSAVGKVADKEMTVATGTYTGDPAKDGEMSITITKYMDSYGELNDVPNPTAEKVTVSNGKVIFSLGAYSRQ